MTILTFPHIHRNIHRNIYRTYTVIHTVIHTVIYLNTITSTDNDMDLTNTIIAVLAFLCGILVSVLMLVAALAQYRRTLAKKLASEREQYLAALREVESKPKEQRFARPEIRRRFLPLDFVTVQINDEASKYHEMEGIVLEAYPNSTYRIMVNGYEMLMPGIFLIPMERLRNKKGDAEGGVGKTKPGN